VKARAPSHGFYLAAIAGLAACGLAGPPIARAGHVAVAPAGPCAAIPARDLCKGGACAASAAPVRGRFDPVNVASDGAPALAPLPNPAEFAGPGPCVDPSNRCGQPTPSAATHAASPGVVEQPPVFVPPP
jgi:hypothetical protein